MAREYRLLDIPDAGSKLQKYRALLDLTSVGDVEYSWDYRWTEFEQSPEFARLSRREQALSRYTMKRVVEDETPWHVLSADDTDNLLGVPSSRYLAPSTIDDAMILSGARGWEISYELIDEDRSAREVLGRLALDDYVNLTVATMLYGSNDNGVADLSYMIPEGDTVLRQTVGGTFHGDFAAHWERFAVHGPVLDPAGIPRDFAPPIAGDHVRAYHSVEDGIAIAMLTYLAAGDKAQLETAKHVMIDAIVELDQGRGGGNFADFGNTRGRDLGAIFVDDFHPYAPGEVIERFGVTPGGRDISMEIAATSDGVELRNIQKTKTEAGKVKTELLGRMEIARKEIPIFVAVMAAASAGRTSLDQIGNAIATAHVWE